MQLHLRNASKVLLVLHAHPRPRTFDRLRRRTLSHPIARMTRWPGGGHVPVPAVLDRLELNGTSVVLLEKVAGRPAGELAVDDPRRRGGRPSVCGAARRPGAHPA